MKQKKGVRMIRTPFFAGPPDGEEEWIPCERRGFPFSTVLIAAGAGPHFYCESLIRKNPADSSIGRVMEVASVGVPTSSQPSVRRRLR